MTTTMAVGNQSGHAQRIFNKISTDYSKKISQFNSQGEQLAVEKSKLGRRIGAFTNGHVVHIPTKEEFDVEIAIYDKTDKIMLRTLVEAKKLQQDCLVCKEFLRPPLIAEKLEDFMELDPDLHKLMVEYAEICADYFDNLFGFENELASCEQHLEKEHQEFRSSLLQFQRIADNNGMHAEQPQAEQPFEQQLIAVENSAASCREIEIPPLTASTAPHQRNISNIDSGNKYLRRIPFLKKVIEKLRNS
ncbi:MAG TPA: hypothetical protein VLE96_00615 [Chlamydiales bacterium]|nr:hypothetical protein [Chlamydiales bacterium]